MKPTFRPINEPRSHYAQHGVSGKQTLPIKGDRFMWKILRDAGGRDHINVTTLQILQLNTRILFC